MERGLYQQLAHAIWFGRVFLWLDPLFRVLGERESTAVWCSDFQLGNLFCSELRNGPTNVFDLSIFPWRALRYVNYYDIVVGKVLAAS